MMYSTRYGTSFRFIFFEYFFTVIRAINQTNNLSISMDDVYKRREECTKAAIKSGTTNALKSLVVAVPIVAFLSTKMHFVKKSVSTKTALIVSPFFFSFFLSSELEMNRCKRRQAGVSN